MGMFFFLKMCKENTPETWKRLFKGNSAPKRRAPKPLIFWGDQMFAFLVVWGPVIWIPIGSTKMNERDWNLT